MSSLLEFGCESPCNRFPVNNRIGWRVEWGVKFGAFADVNSTNSYSNAIVVIVTSVFKCIACGDCVPVFTACLMNAVNGRGFTSHAVVSRDARWSISLARAHWPVTWRPLIRRLITVIYSSSLGCLIRGVPILNRPSSESP